jgi:hypothetical protein
MKTIKAVTDFGIIDVKTIGKKKQILGHDWIIVNYPYRYLNREEPLMIRKVMNYNVGMCLPLYNMQKNATQKDYFEKAEEFLYTIGLEEIKKEFTKHTILN